MRFGLLFALLLLGFRLCGQSKADSLKRELARLDRLRPGFAHDTTRVRLLCELARQSKAWETARIYWQNAMELAEKVDWPAGRLRAYEGLGRHYRSKGSHLEATYYFHKGLHLAEQTGDLHYQADCYRFLGVAYSQAGDLPRSVAALRKAVAMARRSGNRRQYFLSLNDIGNAHHRAKNYHHALHFYQRCIRENRPVDSLFQSWFLINVADIFQLMNRLEDSRRTYEEVFRYGKYLPEQDSAMTYARLAMLHVKLGNAKAALTYSLLAEKIAPRVQGFYTLSLISQALSEAYAHNERWREALTHERQYRAYRDSILSQTQQQRLDGIRVGYDNERRRTELGFLNERFASQQQANRFLWSGVALLGLLGGALVVTNYLLRKRRREIERQRNEIAELNDSLEQRVTERTAELQRVNTELLRKNREIEEALLRGQTLERKRVASELHDNLGGTLTAIRWRMESLKTDELNEVERQIYQELHQMITRAYSEVRLLSHHMMPEILEKEGLETALRELAVPINKSKRLTLTVDAEQVSHLLDPRHQLELYSVVLELLTNILKHARATQAEVRLGQDESGLFVRVTDNGVGMAADQVAAGMGMKNIQTRLNVIGGTWKMDSLPGAGTTFTIQLPLSILHPVPVPDHTRTGS